MKNYFIGLVLLCTSSTAFADYGRRTWTCNNAKSGVVVTVAYDISFASHSLTAVEAIDVTRDYTKTIFREDYPAAYAVFEIFESDKDAIARIEGKPLVIKLWEQKGSDHLLNSVVTLDARRKKLRWDTKRSQPLDPKVGSMLFDCAVNFTPAQ